MKNIYRAIGSLLLLLFHEPALGEDAPTRDSIAPSQRIEIDRAEYDQFVSWKLKQAQQQKNIQTVADVLAAEAREDTEGFFAPFASNSSFWMIGSSPGSGTLHGLPAQKAAFKLFMGQLASGISMEITNAFASGDWVLTEARGRAETLDGRPYNGNYCVLAKFSENQIVEFREYLDTKLLADTFAFE